MIPWFRTLYFFAIVLFVIGCSSTSRYIHFPAVYKIAIQQGNIVEKKYVAQLKIDMTKEQVIYLLGRPILTDTFNQDRWDYVYTLQTGQQPYSHSSLTLFFKRNTLQRIENDMNVAPNAPVK